MIFEIRESIFAEASFYQKGSSLTKLSGRDSVSITSYHWGGYGQGGLAHQFWHKLWLHFFWPTFWLHCILYRTYIGGEAPPISKIQNTM